MLQVQRSLFMFCVFVSALMPFGVTSLRPKNGYAVEAHEQSWLNGSIETSGAHEEAEGVDTRCNHGEKWNLELCAQKVEEMLALGLLTPMQWYDDFESTAKVLAEEASYQKTYWIFTRSGLWYTFAHTQLPALKEAIDEVRELLSRIKTAALKPAYGEAQGLMHVLFTQYIRPGRKSVRLGPDGGGYKVDTKDSGKLLYALLSAAEPAQELSDIAYTRKKFKQHFTWSPTYNTSLTARETVTGTPKQLLDKFLAMVAQFRPEADWFPLHNFCSKDDLLHGWNNCAEKAMEWAEDVLARKRSEGKLLTEVTAYRRREWTEP